MYKYKCLAAKNADKADFYGVTDELKALYPNMTENEDKPSDREFLRRKFWQGEKIVTVQYSFSERTVTVFSEEWLGKFYEDREVAEGRFRLPKSTPVKNKIISIILSIIFVALNIAALVTIAGFVEFRLWILHSALTVIYTISGFLIKSRLEIGEFKILFTQFGGYVSIAVLIISLLSDSWGGMLILFGFFAVVIPSLILSFIIRLTVKFVRKKINL